MATTTTKTETFVGKRVRRREDPRLITGTATYVEDIQMPGMHYAVILRSPHAAARIRSIKAKQAEAASGVVCVFTGKDTKGDRKSTRLNSSHVAISYAVFCLKKITQHVAVGLYTPCPATAA